MAKKGTVTLSTRLAEYARENLTDQLSIRLAEYARENLTDQKRVSIGKKQYLIKNRDNILIALEVGYPYPMIAEVVTAELLETDILKSFIAKTKEGEEIMRETKISVAELKNFCEPERNS